MNKHEHLQKWCDKYWKDTNMRIHPSNVPMEKILNEVLERLFIIESRLPADMVAPTPKEEVIMVRVRGVEIPLSELTGIINPKIEKKGKK